MNFIPCLGPSFGSWRVKPWTLKIRGKMRVASIASPGWQQQVSRFIWLLELITWSASPFSSTDRSSRDAKHSRDEPHFCCVLVLFSAFCFPCKNGFCFVHWHGDALSRSSSSSCRPRQRRSCRRRRVVCSASLSRSCLQIRLCQSMRIPPPIRLILALIPIIRIILLLNVFDVGSRIAIDQEDLMLLRRFLSNWVYLDLKAKDLMKLFRF